MVKWQTIKQHLPMRIIKTGIAVALAYVSMPLFIPGTQFYASMGAMRTMKESIAGSIQIILQQLLANFIGFVFALVFGLALGINIVSVSFAVMALFLVIKYLKLNDTYVMAGVTLMSIMLLSTTEATLIARGFDRFISMGYGMVIAFLINIIIFRPKFSTDIEAILHTITDRINDWFNEADYNKRLLVFNHLNDEAINLEGKIGLIRQDMKTKIATRNDKRLQQKIFATIMSSTRQEIRIIQALEAFERIEYQELYVSVQSLFVIEDELIGDIFAMQTYRHYWELIVHDTETEINKLMQAQLEYTHPRFNETVAFMHALTVYYGYLSTLMSYIREDNDVACDWTQSISLDEITSKMNN